VKPKNDKTYLFNRLIGEGWFVSEKEALPWIMSGKVLVDDRQVLSGKERIPADGAIRVKEYYKKKYVNKGGLKLQKALSDFGVDPQGKVALDCGASTGGFTDCLLQHGAKLVYAVDAGHGMLAGKLLINDKVVNMENTNISDGLLKNLDPRPELATLDLSYLSLKTGVMECRDIMKGSGIIVALIKPIVEVASATIKRNGQVNQRGLIIHVLDDLCGFFVDNSFDITGLTHSPIRGNNGALEYFACLRMGDGPRASINNSYRSLYDGMISESFALGSFDKNNIAQI